MLRFPARVRKIGDRSSMWTLAASAFDNADRVAFGGSAGNDRLHVSSDHLFRWLGVRMSIRASSYLCDQVLADFRMRLADSSVGQPCIGNSWHTTDAGISHSPRPALPAETP